MSMLSIVLSSLKLAAMAQLTVLSTGAVGALCAYHGIFEVAVLKKMSKVCSPTQLAFDALLFQRFSTHIQHGFDSLLASC